MNTIESQADFTESQKRRRIFLVSWHDPDCDAYITIPIILTHSEALAVQLGVKYSSGCDAYIIMGVSK